MPLLIGLLIFCGCFVLGTYFGTGAIIVLAFVFTAPGFIYKKLFPGKAGAVPFGLAFWCAVFGLLYLTGKLTILTVVVGTVVSFAIGIIGMFFYYFLDEFFHFSSMEKRNCIRCGKQFISTYPYSSRHSFCRSCQAAYDGMLKREIQKQNKAVPCGNCNGSGRIKGYKCAQCKGRGSIPRAEDDIVRTAKQALTHNTEWNSFLDYEGSIRY